MLGSAESEHQAN